ncbi:MAG: sensor histidine kinase [Candidatus Enterenecus sp.]
MKMRTSPAVKALAFIMAATAFAASAMIGIYQMANYEALWYEDGSLSNGYTVRRLLARDADDVRTLLSYYRRVEAGEELPPSSAQRMAALEQELSPENTNLRWQVLDQSGNKLYGSTEETLHAGDSVYWSYVNMELAPSELVNVGVWEDENWQEYAGEDPDAAGRSLIEAKNWREALSAAVVAYGSGADMDLDAVYVGADGLTDILHVRLQDDTTLICGPTIRSVIETDEFGYRYDLDEGWLYVGTGERVSLDLVLWLDESLGVADQYQQACAHLSAWREHRVGLLVMTAVLAAAGLCLTVFLCAGAGHKRDREGIYLNWFHRIPGDLMLCAMVTAVLILCALLVELAGSISYAIGNAPLAWLVALTGAAVWAIAVVVMAFLITFAARCKAHTLLRNTLIWRFCAWCRRLVRSVTGAIPLIWKAVAVCAAYLLFSVVFVELFGFLWVIATIVLLAYLCLWAYQWKKIRQGTREIIGGNTDYQIDTSRMLPDLKDHADELNNLGQSIAAAVDERMRSEHFKAELITNVSHDLKTPLTSIINYVDLLKKEDIDNPRAKEYIEVLDRKSQRLKKLTEDLVEASKASTGVLTVNLDRLDLVQLADQALAEYEDRLAQKGLAVVRTLPEEPVWVEADGRHLWRVLDNLLSNCAKYALEGTRVYVEVQGYSDCAKLSVKNISREELNIPPEQLVERFVRGDESRTQEGSGLGLSIAQSLTELQHGQFQVSIDGDLFKATVTLPLAAGPEML